MISESKFLMFSYFNSSNLINLDIAIPGEQIKCMLEILSSTFHHLYSNRKFFITNPKRADETLWNIFGPQEYLRYYAGLFPCLCRVITISDWIRLVSIVSIESVIIVVFIWGKNDPPNFYSSKSRVVVFLHLFLNNHAFRAVLQGFCKMRSEDLVTPCEVCYGSCQL